MFFTTGAFELQRQKLHLDYALSLVAVADTTINPLAVLESNDTLV